MPETPTFTCPIPKVWPFGMEVGSEEVQEVWDTYVKPGQDRDEPQSTEMRILMAILRAVNAGLIEHEKEKG